MSPDMENVDFARESEQFAEDLIDDFEERKNWIVTIRFYSLLHFIEERLQHHGFSSRSHDDRKENIRSCKHTDNRLRTLYRRLEDTSRDARYECIRMTGEDVRMSAETLEEGKRILGYTENGGGETKYSV